MLRILPPLKSPYFAVLYLGGRLRHTPKTPLPE